MHIILVIATSTQVFIHVQNTLGYMRGETHYFYYWFMKNDSGMYNSKGFTRFIDVFEIDDLNKTVRSHIDVFLLLWRLLNRTIIMSVMIRLRNLNT